MTCETNGQNCGCGAEQATRTEARNQNRNTTWFTPAVDIHEETDAVVLTADLPGVAADGVELTVEQGTLELIGRAQRRTPEGVRPSVAEYGVGDFRRTFRLGEDLDPEAVTAQLAGGVLTVRIGKRRATQARKIAVTTGA